MSDYGNEFEVWLLECIEEEKSNEWNIKLGYDTIILDVLNDVLDKWRELNGTSKEQQS